MWTGTAWRWTTTGSVTANDPTPVSSAAVHAAIDGTKRQIWGTATISNSIGPWEGPVITVNIGKTLPSTNYNVQMVLSSDVSYWTWLRWFIRSKSQTSFTVYMFNDSEHTVASGQKFDWLVTY